MMQTSQALISTSTVGISLDSLMKCSFLRCFRYLAVVELLGISSLNQASCENTILPTNHKNSGIRDPAQINDSFSAAST